MRQRNTLVECGFGIASTARLGCKLGHVWTANRMQTCLVLQTFVRREAVRGNCPWINVPECWRRLVLCGGPWVTNMKSLSQIQTACQLLPGTRLVAKSKLGWLRQFENTWHGAEPNWQIAATTWWHVKMARADKRPALASASSHLTEGMMPRLAQPQTNEGSQVTWRMIWWFFKWPWPQNPCHCN